MTNYVLSYHGEGGMPESEEEMATLMEAWGAWFADLGDAVVDGGNPFSIAKTITADGTVSDGGQGRLTGYSVISASDIDAAVAHAKGCPVLAGGGTVCVNEVIEL